MVGLVGDLRQTATRLAQDGYFVLRDEFPQHLLEALREDAYRYSFESADPRSGDSFVMGSLANAKGAPRLAAAWLAGMIGKQVSGQSRNPVDFAPNEASYQRYVVGGRGLPPHRDQRYYISCIAIVTLVGEATFGIHGTRRRSDVVDEWVTSPGEVVLLRGWRPARRSDCRPYHRVDAPSTGHRLMFQLRQNIAGNASTFPLLTELTAVEVEQARQLAATPEAPRI
jgi:hypothetical protein